MVEERRRGQTLSSLTRAGALLSLLGGTGLAFLWAVFPDVPWLSRYFFATVAVAGGFLLLGILGTLAGAMDALRGPSPAPPGPLPAPRPPTARFPRRADLDAPSLYEQVKTYIDLEMWELAHEKAQALVRQYPDSPEAQRLSRNLNELRWKAEPKYLMREGTGAEPRDEQDRIARGLRQMLEQVKTYVELEMWGLARQKAVAIMKGFPDTPQSDEIARLFPEIDRHCRAQDSSLASSVPILSDDPTTSTPDSGTRP